MKASTVIAAGASLAAICAGALLWYDRSPPTGMAKALIGHWVHRYNENGIREIHLYFDGTVERRPESWGCSEFKYLIVATDELRRRIVLQVKEATERQRDEIEFSADFKSMKRHFEHDVNGKPQDFSYDCEFVDSKTRPD